MLIELTNEERDILLQFLNRTDLKGVEVPTYNIIVNKLFVDVSERLNPIEKNKEPVILNEGKEESVTSNEGKKKK